MDILKEFLSEVKNVTLNQRRIVISMRFGNENTGLVAPVEPTEIEMKENVLSISAINDERLDIDLNDFKQMEYDEFEEEYSIQSIDGSISFAFALCA